MDVVDDYPVFGKIERIYVVNADIVLYVRIMSTSKFLEHSYAYVIQQTSTCKTVKVTDLYLHIVFHIRRLTVNRLPSLIIVPKFHIVRTLQT